MKAYAAILSAVFIAISFENVQSQWTRMDCPKCTNIFSFALKDSSIFACTDSGIFISTNEGVVWTKRNTGLTNTYVTAITTYNGKLFAATGSGIYASTNDGTSWDSLSNGPLNPLQLLTYNGYIFAGTDGNGIYYSSDGISWSVANVGLQSLNIAALARCNGNIWAISKNYSYEQGEIYSSSDSGQSWVQIRKQFRQYYMCIGEYSGIILVSWIVYGEQIGQSGGVYISKNNGISWTLTGLNHQAVTAFAGNNDIIIAAARTVSNIGTLGSPLIGGVYYSIDSGTSWAQMNTGFPNSVNVTALAMNDKYIFAGLNLDSGTIWRIPISNILPVIIPNRIGKAEDKKVHISIWGKYLTIRYNLRANSQVRFGIIGMSGEKFAVVDLGYQAAGENTMRVSIGKIPVGIYLCRFEAGNDCQHIKIISVR
jgi:hypothetical protein